MRFPIFAVALTLPMLLVGCGEPAEREPTIENAWIRMPAVSGRPAAAYFTIRGGDKATMIEGLGSTQVEKIELHGTSMEGGVARMGPLEDTQLPAGGELVFEPGGKHAMLFGMRDRVGPGSDIPLYFRFSNDVYVKAHATVVAAGDPAPSHDGH